MFPILAPEMAQEEVEQLRAEATKARAASAHPGAPPLGPRPSAARRLASAVRTVSAGFRLLAGAVDGR